MAEENYTKDDLTRVFCNAFKSLLQSLDEDDVPECQVETFLEGILDQCNENNCHVHCVLNTKEHVWIDLKLDRKREDVIALFSDICKSVDQDESLPDVMFGVYILIKCN